MDPMSSKLTIWNSCQNCLRKNPWGENKVPFAESIIRNDRNKVFLVNPAKQKFQGETPFWMHCQKVFENKLIFNKLEEYSIQNL